MILLALNELNIEYVQKYAQSGKLPGFAQLFQRGVTTTTSESRHELLEPWIQWVTVHTGMPYEAHKVFRLGDITSRPELTQIFELLESRGLSIGAVSPFNAENRLKNALFYVPDPWTLTKPSGSLLLKKLASSISHIVNTNATARATNIDLATLLAGVLAYTRPCTYPSLIKLLAQARMPGVKAAILDTLLSEVFITLHKRTRPDFSYLFLNGGAHIQHHYLFNSSMYSGVQKNPEWYCPSSWDPLFLILCQYDSVISHLLSTGEPLVCVTGLHQKPHSQTTYYWRPINHLSLLRTFGITDDISVVPRMSRDFLVIARDAKTAASVKTKLLEVIDSDKKKPVFSVDDRGESLFVELVYAGNLPSDLYFSRGVDRKICNLQDQLAFVAIKNGEHDAEGYVLSNIPNWFPRQMALADLHRILCEVAVGSSSRAIASS